MKRLLDAFLLHLMTERYVSQHTVDAYRRDIEQFIDFLTKMASVQTFQSATLQHIKDYLKHLKYVVKVSSRSASRKLSALKAFSNYVHIYHAVPLFTKGAIFPKLSKHLPKHLTEEQVHEIVTAAGQDSSILGQRNKMILCLLYACGMRVSELVALNVSHINFSEKYVQVMGKGNKERIIPIPAEVMILMQRYLCNVYPQLIRSATSESKADFLFPVVLRGQVVRLQRQTIAIIIKSLAQKAGLLHKVSPHVLRHSLATHLLKRGANLRVLQMLLGHEKLTTVQVYTHMDVSHLRKLYDTYHPRNVIK